MEKFEICTCEDSKSIIGYRKTLFPNSEILIEIEDKHIPIIEKSSKILISGAIKYHHDVFELGLLNQVLKRFNDNIHLELVKHLYGRQDHVMGLNVSLGMKFFSEMINSMGFKTIEVYHPHSEVTLNLLNNSYSYIMPIDMIIEKENINVLVFPDAGASKNLIDYIEQYKKDYIIFSKKRLRDDSITNMDIEYSTMGNLPINGNYLICDDICDGGATFINVANYLNNRLENIHKVVLFVNNGLFTKGTEQLRNNGIDKIYSTDDSGIIQKQGYDFYGF